MVYIDQDIFQYDSVSEHPGSNDVKHFRSTRSKHAVEANLVWRPELRIQDGSVELFQFIGLQPSTYSMLSGN